MQRYRVYSISIRLMNLKRLLALVFGGFLMFGKYQLRKYFFYSLVTHTLELLLPESSEPGLLLPCKTVAVQHDDTSRDYRAFVTAVSIKVPGRKNARISQTVTLDQPVAWEDYSA